MTSGFVSYVALVQGSAGESGVVPPTATLPVRPVMSRSRR